VAGKYIILIGPSSPKGSSPLT